MWRLVCLFVAVTAASSIPPPLLATYQTNTVVGVKNTQQLVFAPIGSKAAVSNGTLGLDVPGAYVLEAANGTRSMLSAWGAEDFGGVADPVNVFQDTFSQRRAQDADRSPSFWETSCASHASGLTLPASCALTSSSPVYNPFATSTRLSAYNVSLPAAEPDTAFLLSLTASPASGDAARISLTLFPYALTASLVFSPSNASLPRTIASGGLPPSCSSSLFTNVTLRVTLLTFSVWVDCGSNGLSLAGDHNLAWATFAAGTGGAMHVELSARASVVHVAQVEAASLLARRLPALLAPIPNLSGFTSRDLGQQHAANFEVGFLDPTLPPFGADKSGGEDSTTALQRALDFARRNYLALYLPGGTYVVSDTLVSRQVERLDALNGSNTEWQEARYSPGVIRGASVHRPRILLAPRSPGFTNASDPKPVIRFWMQNGFGNSQPNANANQYLRGVDVEIGAGNFGAIAVRARGAQGIVVSDVTIVVGDGLVGLSGGSGSGGSHSNLTVIGGRFGVDFTGSQPGPTATGFTLQDQSCAAFVYAGLQSLTAVGLTVRASMPHKVAPIVAGCPLPLPHGVDDECALPQIMNVQPCNIYDSGHVTLLDSVLDVTGAQAAILSSGKSVILRNVYSRGAAAIASFGDGIPAIAPASPLSWSKVALYVQGVDPAKCTKPVPLQLHASVYVDGVAAPSNRVNLTVEAGVAPPAGLTERHVYNGASALPAWDGPHVMYTKAAGAAGDGITDDAGALQRAIDEAAATGRTLVFNRGVYRVSKTLALPPGANLLGLGLHMTSIVPVSDGLAPFPATDGLGAPVLFASGSSSADPTGTGVGTVLDGISVTTFLHLPKTPTIVWEAGPNSILTHFHTNRMPECGESRGPPLASAPPGVSCKPSVNMSVPLNVFRGNASGSVNVFYNEDGTIGDSDVYGVKQTADYRHILVDGVSGLSFYHLNPEHAVSDANCEIRGSHNVSVYGVKSEGVSPSVWVRDSDGVFVSGHAGNANPSTTYPPGFYPAPPSLYRITNSTNVWLGNLWRYRSCWDARPVVYEEPPSGSSVLTPAGERPVLFATSPQW